MMVCGVGNHVTTLVAIMEDFKNRIIIRRVVGRWCGGQFTLNSWNSIFTLKWLKHQRKSTKINVKEAKSCKYSTALFHRMYYLCDLDLGWT
jgi:hypothetical protein